MKIYLIILSTFLTHSTFVHASQEPSVSTQGTCRRELPADRSAITFNVEIKDNDAQVASRKATEVFERLRKRIREHKIDKLDLETTEFSVNELRDWNNGKSIFRGYEARAGLRVSSADFTFSSKAIALALKEGIRNVGQLNSYVSTEAIDKARFDCLQEAVRNARAKAVKLAEAGNAKVGKTLQITEMGGDEPQQAPAMYTAKLALGGGGMGDNGPTIEGGKTTVSTNISATFQLR